MIGKVQAVAAVLLCAAISGHAAAQEATAPPPPAAQPAPLRVGRVAFLIGKVEWRRAGENGWSAAAVNAPIAAGMSLRTDAAGRAELHFAGNAVAIAGDSTAQLTGLDDRALEIALAQGRLDAHLHRLDDGATVTIVLPHGHVRLQRPGWYDIDAGNEKTPARLTVFAGEAHLLAAGADRVIAAGKRAEWRAAASAGVMIAAAGEDGFSDWCRARDAKTAGDPLPPGVSPRITGLAALAGYGSWQVLPGRGAAWFPDDLPAGWAPYREGRWQWIPPWGWTWFDAQPWGFAPSHYGRWARIGEHWAWLPGAPGADPAYAPALVDFLGTPAVGVSVADRSTPAVGWFPLAPGEVYWPRYSDDLGYIRRLNAGSVGDLEAIHMDSAGNPPVEVTTHHFANRAFATIVPRPVFVGGRPTAAAQLALPHERLINLPVLLGSPRIRPPETTHAAAAAHAAVAVLRGERHAAPRKDAGHPAHPRGADQAHAAHRHPAPHHIARFGSSRPPRHRAVMLVHAHHGGR